MELSKTNRIGDPNAVFGAQLQRNWLRLRIQSVEVQDLKKSANPISKNILQFNKENLKDVNMSSVGLNNSGSQPIMPEHFLGHCT